MAKGLRPKVKRVIKLKAFKRARRKDNPFNLNAKDWQQLNSWQHCFYKFFVDI